MLASSRYRKKYDINFWPSMSDTLFILLLIFIFVLFTNFIMSMKYLVIQKNQLTMQKKILSEMIAYKEDIVIESDGNLQRIRFSDKVLFNMGSYELKDRGKSLLSELGKLLQKERGLYSQIQVEGHTDDIPINKSTIPTNWELSALRATTVVKYMQSEGIDPAIIPMVATGYSEFHPISTDKQTNGGFTQQARELNRRIEIVLVYLEKDLVSSMVGAEKH